MKKPVTFGLVTDVQYAAQDSPQPQRNTPLSIEKLATAVADFNTQDLAFVIQLGDIIDRDEANFPAILDVINQSRVPVWHVLGNHEFCGPRYDYGHKAEALKAFGMSDQTRYYHRDIGGWRFIILDSNEIGVIESKPGTPEHRAGQRVIDQLKAQNAINAEIWNGAISAKQKAWLTKLIDQAGEQDMRCIIFAHHAIYPNQAELLLNHRELLELLATKPCVKAYINGHNHDGAYGTYKGLHCWTVEGMVDYPDKTAYATVELYDDRMVIHGCGRVKSRELSFR